MLICSLQNTREPGGVFAETALPFQYQTSPTWTLTLYAQLEADVTEGQRSSVRVQLTDGTDVVIIQIYIHKLLLFNHCTCTEVIKVKNSILYISIIYTSFYTVPAESIQSIQQDHFICLF